MNKDFWERIDKLEELARKATGGNWGIFKEDDSNASWIVSDLDEDIDICEVFNISGDDDTFIAAANPAMILEMIATFKGRLSFLEHELVEKDIELENTKAELKRLEKEADWLAKMCRGFCDGHNYCNECVHYPRGCPISKEIEYRFDKHEVEDWRKAARKSVSENNNA